MTTTNPTDAQMKLARELMTKAAPMFPITTHNGPDYADVTFAEDHSSQAMTMEPDTWNALNELFVSLPAIFDAIQATEARAQGLVDALEDSKRAVQAFLDMVNVMQRVQALPIPVFLETAQHNCPIILQNLDQALATWRRT